MARPRRRATATALAKRIESASRHSAHGARQRLGVYLDALGAGSDGTTVELLERLADTVSGSDPSAMWLALSVLSGALANEAQVLRAWRAADLDGPLSALADVLVKRRTPSTRNGDEQRVAVISDRVVVDIASESVGSDPSSQSGIDALVSEMARALTRQWTQGQHALGLAWNDDGSALCATVPSGSADPHDARPSIVVPWRCTYLLPGRLNGANRIDRFLALARYSQNHTAAIGYGTMPASQKTNSATPEAGSFANFLAALAHVDRIAAISAACAGEFTGWRRMLSGAGIDGPDIAAIPLPQFIAANGARPPVGGRADIVTDDLPLVLAVSGTGTEQNHLAVLQAAELLWRERRSFSLVVVGADPSAARKAALTIERLAGEGRPIRFVDALSTDQLATLYAAARCTVCVSLHEPFARPVAESIAFGTPVITSAFGSMRELGESGGALLVDPRSDGQIADALRRLVSNDTLRAELVQQARSRPTRTFDDYAKESFNYLVEGTAPHSL